MKKLLLHVCCASCAIALLEELTDYKITLFFYNPNITDQAEYEKRLAEVRKLANIYELELIVGDYESEKFLGRITGLEAAEEGGVRCQVCYEMRLKKALAYLDDFALFATSLVVSPYKNKSAIDKIGTRITAKYLVLSIDSNLYQKANEKIKANNIYRQKYCGCSFSKKA